MITVLDVIKLSTDYLQKKGVESPRANAEILLAEILKCKRLELYLSFDKPLADNEIQVYREVIRKRGLRIPLQYIIGSVDFYGLKLIVNENVLIPRPETEILVESVINELKNFSALKILDVGSGSGNISLALAKNLPDSNVIGIDISEEAIKLSKNNALSNSISNANILCIDIFSDEIFSLGKFDLIVSNPPYVSKTDFNELEPELKNYEPKIALTDDEDGLKYYKRITSIARDLLNPSGKIFFELGKDQYDLVKNIMTKNGFDNIKVFKDYQHIERIIYGELN